jgi:hypothetical protein
MDFAKAFLLELQAPLSGQGGNSFSGLFFFEGEMSSVQFLPE